MSSETAPDSPIEERRLAAIMFTDVAGYSSRTQKDETGTLALVRADFARMKELCSANGGEVLTTMGDGMLVCFSSTVRAVSAALAIQSEFGLRRETLPPEQCLEHRIGIHLGDIFVRDGNVAGDGVNIAARLQTKAPVGGISISQTVHDTVKGKLAMQSVFIGPQSFKNILEPISVYHLSPEGSKAPAGAPPSKGKKAMIVIGSLVAVLAGVALVVFRHQPAPLEAPVPVVAKPAVVAPPLAPIAAPPAAPVVAAAAPSPAARNETDELIAKSRSFFGSDGEKREDFIIAENFLKKATNQDPISAEAWAAYSELNSAYVRTGFDRSRERIETARSQAERAVKLKPDSAVALLAFAHVQRIRAADPVDAEAAFRAVLKVDAANAEATRGLADVLRSEGRFDEALNDLQKIDSLPGIPGASIHLQEAQLLFGLRRFDQADAILKGLSAGKNSALVPVQQALLEITWHGNAQRALSYLAQLPVARRGDEEVVFLTVYLHILARQPEEALTELHAHPIDYFQNSLFTGPHGLLAGVALTQLKKNKEAQEEWEVGLAEVKKRELSNPVPATLKQAEALLLAQLGRTADAQKMARAAARKPYREGAGTSWTEDPVLVLCFSGRDNDTLGRIDHLLIQPAIWPLTPALLRLDPAWDFLRDNARFAKLAGVEPGQKQHTPGAK